MLSVQNVLKNKIKKQPVSEYQKKLQCHYAKFGVEVLPSDTLVKSCTEGLKTKGSKLLNQNFTTKEKERLFKRIGIPFLKPDKVWSGKKIDITMDSLQEEVKVMQKDKTLNKENLQKPVAKLVPDANITIKDFSDLKKSLEEEGLSDETIEAYMNCGAINSSGIDGNEIFLDFKKVNSPKISDQVSIIDETLHECRHAIREQKTNDIKLIQTTINHKAEFLDFFTNSFGLFSRPYDSKEQVKKINTTTFLQWQTKEFRIPQKAGCTSKIRSTKNLHSNFKKAFNFFSEQENYKLPDDFQERKIDLKFMKLRAFDEAGSYKTGKIWRTFHNDLSTPTQREFISLHYNELGKFFHNQILDNCFTRLQEIKAQKKAP